MKERSYSIDTAELRRNARRAAAGLALLAVAGLLSGCVARGATAATTTQPAAAPCADDRPVHVIVAVSAWESGQPKARAALAAVLQQVRALATQADSPGTLVALYGMDARSLEATPTLARTPCAPSAPERPDPKTLGTFKLEEAARDYQQKLALVAARRQKAAAQVDALQRETEARAWPTEGPSFWGVMTLATRTFRRDEASRRYVVLIARDESPLEATRHPNYDLRALELRGALVYWLNFDMPTPADQERRTWETSCWVYSVGASHVAFFRSNDVPAALFGPAPPAARYRPGELPLQACRR